MSSITKPVAQALSYRWGELEEEPPEVIHDLMVDLTRALEEAEAEGEADRAECLDEVIEDLAEGIVKHEWDSTETIDQDTLASATAEIRAYYYKESSIRPAPARGAQEETRWQETIRGPRGGSRMS